MPYAFSVLFFILSLVTGIPAIPKLLRMRKIKQNSARTTGLVRVAPNTEGVRMAAFLGNTNYPQIFYRTADEKEHTIEVVDDSNFRMYRYESGESVEVVYDRKFPWQAYVGKEWNKGVRDVWMAGGELLLSILLWNIGLALGVPI
jgi:hypothetical protein